MAAYIRLSIKGTLPGGEVWSINPVIDPANELGWDTFDQGSFDAFTHAVGGIALPADLKSVFSAATAITSIRAELRHTDSETFLGASEYTLPTPITGSGTAYKPAQIALVVSLRSNSALASGRGRLYVPATGVPMDSATLRLSPTTTLAVANAMKTYLTAVCDAAKAQLTPVSLVQFGISVYSPTKKTLTPVTSLRVGNVLDTQRRRRDSLMELYSTVPL